MHGLCFALAHVAAGPSTAAAAALDGQRLADVCAQELAPVLTHVLDDGLWHQAGEVCCWLAGVRPCEVQRRQLVDLCRGGRHSTHYICWCSGRQMLAAGDPAALLAGARHSRSCMKWGRAPMAPSAEVAWRGGVHAAARGWTQQEHNQGQATSALGAIATRSDVV